MKITKHGKNIKKFVCPKCGCEFEMHIDECKAYISTALKIFHFYACPECGMTTYAKDE